MLKTVFMAPDPGRARLRFAARALLGIGLAVVVCGLAGHSLVGAVTGGLAALLALFTVTDATVRGQAVTTALLPAVGLPVLGAAAVLHDQPVLRDLTFLAVIGAGVYARRWGPRGHSLGVFAFMMFFVAQFLQATRGQLPELYAAVLLSLLSAAAVRFGVWCYERGLPPAAVPAPPGGTGLDRVTTRQAVQATVGAGFALVVGQLLSGERWYWAVGATWWIFVNTTSRGETLVRGFRRVLGTVIGIGLGLLLAVPVAGSAVPTAVLVAVCVFGIFYTAAVSYTWMMLWVTLLAELLYGLLGVLTPGLLALRLAETGVGAVGAVLAVLFVLPVTTHTITDAWIRRALRCVHACTAEAAARLAGDDSAAPAARVAELEQLLGRVRLAVAPLVHPLNPMRGRKRRAAQVLTLLDACAHEIRGLVTIAADPEASHDARLAAACWRVHGAVEALVEGEAGAEARAGVAANTGAEAGAGVADAGAAVHIEVAGVARAGADVESGAGGLVKAGAESETGAHGVLKAGASQPLAEAAAKAGAEAKAGTGIGAVTQVGVVAQAGVAAKAGTGIGAATQVGVAGQAGVAAEAGAGAEVGTETAVGSQTGTGAEVGPQTGAGLDVASVLPASGSAADPASAHLHGPLAHLHGLERALTELAQPLRAPSGSPLVGA
ncbi:FUSC family protein [Streptomyces sp. NPDC018693]|uniref:FUSC family protein n=1 Tax=unclassified Streptomyces TaxID=2593676 RepID=UPI0037A3AA86